MSPRRAIAASVRTSFNGSTLRNRSDAVGHARGVCGASEAGYSSALSLHTPLRSAGSPRLSCVRQRRLAAWCAVRFVTVLLVDSVASRPERRGLVEAADSDRLHARSVPTCPICEAPAPEVIRSFTIDVVATHFVPASRDLRRHGELRELLAELWEGRESVDVHQCRSCSFGFAHPWVAGSARFYNLVSDSDPHYPRDRWEFGRTIECLGARAATLSRERNLRLLEIGSGSGAFLEKVRSSPVGRTFSLLAIEYNRGAVHKLEQGGFEVSPNSVQQLAESDTHRGKFAAICLFQTLEHIADVHGMFRAMRALLSEDGALFISAPFGPSTEIQEELTSYWDLPPNHVGRWTPRAFDSIAEQHGFRVVEWELEAKSRLDYAWRLAGYAVLAKAYDETSVPGRINALRLRSIRGPLKRVVALAFIPKILKAWHRLSPPTQWVHMAAVRATAVTLNGHVLESSRTAAHSGARAARVCGTPCQGLGAIARSVGI
jgi:cyclopropane fatty-acyl-phospholipid synthase-like methyltransferase